jgi:hypothetical protein
MGYNPNPVHWLDVSPASYYIEAKRNKGSKMWHCYVEWRVITTHDSDARVSGIDSHPDQEGIFRKKTLISFLSDNVLKNEFINL